MRWSRREVIKSVTASNDNGMEVSKLKEELAQTKLDQLLYHSKADCLSAEWELESAQERVDSVMLRHEQKRFAAMDKAAIGTPKDRLAKAESTPSNASKVVDDLQAKVKELT
jgi:hypothetical protein